MLKKDQKILKYCLKYLKCL